MNTKLERHLMVELSKVKDQLNLLLENITVHRDGTDISVGIRLNSNYRPRKPTPAAERLRYIARLDATLRARQKAARK